MGRFQACRQGPRPHLRPSLLDLDQPKRQHKVCGGKSGNAELETAVLTAPRLDGADLSGADLSNALLEGVDLGQTKGLSVDQLATAVIDSTTLFPATLDISRLPNRD